MSGLRQRLTWHVPAGTPFLRFFIRDPDSRRLACLLGPVVLSHAPDARRRIMTLLGMHLPPHPSHPRVHLSVGENKYMKE